MTMRMRFALALIALVAADASGEGRAPLGTLFQTPQERAALDRAQRGEPVSETSGLRANPVITGYVKRSDGKSTVFIDNQPFDVKGAKAEAHLQPRNVRSYVAQPPSPPPSPPEEAQPAPASSKPKPPAARSGT
jgi:hypothetical protein